MASVLVTGASGFIGMKCVDALLAKKHRVFGTDSTPNGMIGTNPNYSFVQCEITDKDTISGMISANKLDTIVHLANSTDNDFDSYITDTELKKAKVTDKYLYETAAKYDIKNFILLSTTAVYGVQKGREPIRETVSEKGSTNYAELKMNSEKMLMKGFKKSDCVPVIARVAPIYTAEYTQNLRDKVYDEKEDVNFFINDGLYGFTFCCLYNLFDFIKGIINVPSGRYDGIYNVCDSEQITAKQILDYERDHHRVGAIVQKTSTSGFSFNKAKARTDYRYFDPSTSLMNWRYDNTKSRRIAPMKWTLATTK